jgi:3-methyl-2-oxobutanoate hydroxymethyltransferase
LPEIAIRVQKRGFIGDGIGCSLSELEEIFANGQEARNNFRLAAQSPTLHCLVMLRPDKKYSVYDLRQLKGKRCLTHVHVKSPEEAAAAEEAGIDLLSCSFDSPAAQARLPLLVAAAPRSFISGSTPHGMATPEEAIRTGFRALEMGASSVYCSCSPLIIEAMAREGIPVVGHLGMVPRHATWTNIRAIGKTSAEARTLYDQMKRLENAGAYAAELELVPHQLAAFLCKKTSLLLMSLGSGNGCDSQFLFSDDILGDYDERIPRHAKAYRNFRKEFQRLQDERIAAFKEYAADVKGGSFPAAGNLISMDDKAFKDAVKAIDAGQPGEKV